MACGRCAKRVGAFGKARWARLRVHGAGVWAESVRHEPRVVRIAQSLPAFAGVPAAAGGGTERRPSGVTR